MIHRSPVEYYLLNEMVASREASEKAFEIINENHVSEYGRNLFTLTFKILMSEFGRRNWNGRDYGEKVFMRALDGNPLIQHDLHAGPNGRSRWCGEYAHPDLAGYPPNSKQALARQMTINPQYASHTIDRYWKEGNKLYGIWTTLVGAWGEVMRDRLLTGFPAMASTRSVGGCDAQGNVLPGLTICTIDGVIRPSSQDAWADMSSVKVNSNFTLPAGSTMSESAIAVNPSEESFKDSFKDFLLSESVSKQKISQVCDTLGMDYSSMAIVENALHIERIDGDSRTTLVMPLRRLVNQEYYNLF